MFEVASEKVGGPFPEIWQAFTRKQTWAMAIGLFAALFVAIRWPTVWEFSLLCCFPAGLFCYSAVSSGVIHRPPMTKIVIVVIVVHCLMLAGTIHLWKKYPRSVTGDFAFGFVALELALIWLLGRFARPRGTGTDART